MPLGDGSFIELLANADPDEAKRSPLGAAFVAAIAAGDGLLGWALATDDLDSVAARLGTSIGSVGRKGMTARLTGVEDSRTDPYLPFFIERATGPGHQPRAGRDHLDRGRGPGKPTRTMACRSDVTGADRSDAASRAASNQVGGRPQDRTPDCDLRGCSGFCVEVDVGGEFSTTEDGGLHALFPGFTRREDLIFEATPDPGGRGFRDIFSAASH